MYPHFIEVKNDSGRNVLVNIDQISTVHGSYINTTQEHNWIHTEEKYDDLKQLILDSGCLIAKADPRLDTKSPLTFEEMRTMKGEPVWNSNREEWGLVVEPAYADMVTILYDEDKKKNYYAGDLIAFPFYRMKGVSLVDKLNEVRK